MASRMFAVLDAAEASSTSSSSAVSVTGARLGRWLGSMATPAALVPTQSGLPPHMTPDVLARVGEARALAMRLPHLLTQAAAVKAAGVSMATFLNVPDKDTFLLTRDPRTSLIPRHSDKEAVLETASGRKKVSVDLFCNVVRDYRPDVVAALSDEVPAAGGGKRRSAQAVERTLKWLDATLAAPPFSTTLSGSAGAGSSDKEAPQLLGVVVGGDSQFLRVRSAEETAKRDVAGFVLGGFGTGESRAERCRLLAECISRLPADKPRVAGGGFESPLEVLDAVSAGVDVIDACYPYTLSRDRFASTFVFRWPELADDADMAVDTDGFVSRAGAPADGSHIGDGTKLLLSEPAFARDTRALVPGCTCYACTDHSRAYVHHLVNTHEMLADVLLFTHNLHHWLGFFAEIRRAIAAGRFEEYRAWVEANFGFTPGAAGDAAAFGTK